MTMDPRSPAKVLKKTDNYPCQTKLIERAAMSGHSDRVWSCAWRFDGKVLASCGADGAVRLWTFDDEVYYSNTTCIAILKLKSQEKTVRRVSWSGDGRFIAAASFDGRTLIWHDSLYDEDVHDEEEEEEEPKEIPESKSWKVIAELDGHENEVKCATWNISGETLATSGRDKTIWIYSQDEDKWDCEAILTGHSQDVKFVKWHPKEDILCSCSYDDTVKIWGRMADDWGLLHTLRGHTSTVWSASFDSHGTYLATSSDDKTVRIWRKGRAFDPSRNSQARNASIRGWHITEPFKARVPFAYSTNDNNSTWVCVSTIEGFHNRVIYQVDWLEDHNVIATACGDNGLRVFKAVSDDRWPNSTWLLDAAVPEAHFTDVNCVAWRPMLTKHSTTSAFLATASDDGLVKLWTYNHNQENTNPPQQQC